MNGDVVGINTAILGQSGSIGMVFQFLQIVQKVINQLIGIWRDKKRLAWC